MNRTDRLYAIAEQLRMAGRPGRTSRWLADRFEVSVRTVKRDVSALQQAGVPIWAQPGPGGGYVLDRAASLPPLNFTGAEAVALAVALAASPDAPLATDGRTALAKVLAAMPQGEQARASDLARRVWTRRPAGSPRAPHAGVLDEALRRNVVASIDYESADGTVTTRRVEPVALASTRGHWYLMGFCRLRQGPRWFRTDRVLGARLTTEKAPAHDPATFAGTPPDDAAPMPIPATADG